MPTYNQFDVVVVPFPFTDRMASKRRPALVVSDGTVFDRRVGHSLLAMITTASHSRWPLDIPIQDLVAAGLKAPSIVRMKLFTLDCALILKQIGRLGVGDREVVKKNLGLLFNL